MGNITKYIVHNEDDYNNTMSFFELEKQMDMENCREMLNIEPSHLTKAKITEMGKLQSRYEKERKATIKEYKEKRERTLEPNKYNELGTGRKWLKKIREFDLDKLNTFTKREFEDTIKDYMKGQKEWNTT
jgi:hypothetical protein